MLPIYNEKIAKYSSGTYYGIDLGTTYTVVARIDLSEKEPGSSRLPVKLITIEQHSPLEMDGSDRSDMVASVLGVDANGRMYVGNKLYRLKGHPAFGKDKNLFYHWKLDLGISKKPLYKDAVRADLDDAAKVAGKILNYCRLQVVGKDREWNDVIVTVPASFQANQRNDVMNAIAYSRIKQEPNMLIDEPNAAFIGYLNQLTPVEKQELLHCGAKHILVIDFGGGTCDLSILKTDSVAGLELKIANLAISRYNDLGGQDLDLMIAESYLLPCFMEQSGSENFTPEELEKVIIPQLAVMAEKLKIDLSRTISARFQEISRIDGQEEPLQSNLENQTLRLRGKDWSTGTVTLTLSQLTAVVSYLFTDKEYALKVVDKVIQSVPCVIDDILKKSNLLKSEIDYVLYAGGSVQNLLFVKETAALFPNAETLLPRRPDTLVAQGAAVYSFYRNALGIELLRPICSDTIGVTMQNAPFYPLIEAGTGLPAEVDLPTFRLQSMNQKKVSIPFCIGDASKVVKTLSFDVPGLVMTDTGISIKAILSVDKILTAEVRINDKVVAEAELKNPFVLANISDEERELSESIERLTRARAQSNRNEERQALYNLMKEYYELGNYTRAAALGEEWLSKFTLTDGNVHNYVYCSYNALGQRRKSEEILDQGLKYSPNHQAMQYNKSLQVERNSGTPAALKYLTDLPENLQSDTSIKFRIALLELATGQEEKAQKIAGEYQEGSYRYLSNFDEGLLRKILKKFDVEYSEKKEQIKRKKAEFDTGQLLRVNAGLPTDK